MTQNTEGLERSLLLLAKFIKNISIILFYGLKGIGKKPRHYFDLSFLLLPPLWLLLYLGWIGFVLRLISPPFFSLSSYFHGYSFASYVTLTLIYGIGLIFIVGVKEFRRRILLQRALDWAFGHNSHRPRPKIKRLFETPSETKIIVHSPGVGVERYEAKKGDLTSGFGAEINSIRFCKNPRYVQISLIKNSIPRLCHYKDMEHHLKGDCNFLVGESTSGIKTCSLTSLPHLLIAGTTGGGKSVFFKQVLLGLLEHSKHLQLYLVDLKGGVEMKVFEKIPCVRVLKTESEAVFTLRKISLEMKKRFTYLEQKGFNQIEPQRDQKDRIIIGIDEASVLYTSSKRKTTEDHFIQEARQLTDELSKLARAAGIHLILATQKVTKETIDTKIQENIGGRMCFRMNTLQGSMTVLGNKMAMDLPDIKGRGIWSQGCSFVEVQTPYLSEGELQERCDWLSARQEEDYFQNFQPLLQIEQERSINKIVRQAYEEK